MESTLSRRKFLGTSALAGTALAISACSSTVQSYKRIIGANDRIMIGIIGCGNRGATAHMPKLYEHVESENFEITALADPWKVSRENANAKVNEWFGRDARQFISYEDLLALDDIDAVTIASPDHHHTTQLIAAARARKDVYVEKPLGMRLDRVVEAVDAVKKSGIVCQVGTQLRSKDTFVGCRDLYQTGILGTVSRIEQCRNSEKPYWYAYLRDVNPGDVDWKEFLGDRPMRPFDPVMFSAWYGYYEFSEGPVPQWGVHYLDLVHYITGATFPSECMCMQDIFTWKDEHNFTAPDHVQAMWTYPEGFMVHYSTNFGNGFGNTFKAYGDQGVLKMDHWGEPVLTAEGGSQNRGVIRGENPVEPIERPGHWLNWLQCIRSREIPHASIDAGFQHAVASIMATESARKGRKTLYDPQKRKISFA